VTALNIHRRHGVSPETMRKPTQETNNEKHLILLNGSETGKAMIEHVDVFTRKSLPLFIFPLSVSNGNMMLFRYSI
jgi:hypothetical protein